ncbi:MAG: hypothetical protein Ct9H300mP31_18160 [Acidimicrobiaceae bacterium]|nr:MAG: hypothetical protein Ct9H300mP31_18160 [Acidimicrobiaceae bacterium]
MAFIDKNSIEYFELAFGAAYLNAVTVAVNWRLAPPEMAYIVNDSQAKVLVNHEEFAEQLATFEADLTHSSGSWSSVRQGPPSRTTSGEMPTDRIARGCQWLTMMSATALHLRHYRPAQGSPDH